MLKRLLTRAKSERIHMEPYGIREPQREPRRIGRFLTVLVLSFVGAGVTCTALAPSIGMALVLTSAWMLVGTVVGAYWAEG